MANPLKDFSRLHTEIPDRSSVGDLRLARRNTLKFLDEMKTDQFKWPVNIGNIDTDIRFYLSRVIDRSALRVSNEAVRLIQKEPEHKANYQALIKAPKNCGGFKVEKSILPDANHFEQMVALDHVISVKAKDWPVGRRTYAFYHDDTQVIPIYVSSKRNCLASTMTTTLGAGKGPYKVPTYEGLADSEEQAQSSIFIKPLESLEYVRQPYFSGATILKANAFEAGIIDNLYRYAVENTNGTPFSLACVELKQQNHRHQAPVKELSAGSNVLFLEKNSPKKTLVKTLNYEDWSVNGYRDDVETSLKVKEYWKVLNETVRSRETEELDNMMRNLFVSRVGPFTSSNVNAFYAEKLFSED